MEQSAGVATAPRPVVGAGSMARATWPADLLVYLVLGALTAAAWWVSQQGWFRSGDDIGYWLGVAGGVMLLLLFSYPLRKRMRFMQRLGKAKWWFLVHMVLGVGGPLLILVHANFHVRSLNASAALYSMLVVALSGLVGRFIYVRINRSLHGEQADFQALQARAGLDQSDSRSRLSFAPEVEQRLLAFAAHDASLRPGLMVSLRRVFWLPVSRLITARRCRRELDVALETLARDGQWEPAQLARRRHLAHKLVRRYLDSAVTVAQFTAYERLFSLWHLAHLPFVYLFVITAIVHVLAVHAY